MKCTVFDVACRIDAALSPILFWVKMGFWAFIALVVLAFLAWIYRQFGWWGVLGAVTIGGAGWIWSKGVQFGQEHSNALPDTPEKPKKKPRKSGPTPDSVWEKWKHGEKVD